MASRARAIVSAVCAGALAAACNPARDPAPLIPEIPSSPPTSPESPEPSRGGGAPALPLEPPPIDAAAPEPPGAAETVALVDGVAQRADAGAARSRGDAGVDAGVRPPVDAGRPADAGAPIDAPRAVDAAPPIDASVPLLPDATPRPLDAGLLRPDANQPLL